jgi:hypothetical protein
VEIFLECILENRFVEIIYLHGATPLQASSGRDVSEALAGTAEANCVVDQPW